jgi:hypothetical protein
MFAILGTLSIFSTSFGISGGFSALIGFSGCSIFGQSFLSLFSGSFFSSSYFFTASS